MPARVNKIRHDEGTRSKIQAAQIINRFMACVNGEVELSPAQVSAGKTLLNKVLPDLQSTSLEGQVTHEVGDSVSRLMEAINGRTRSK